MRNNIEKCDMWTVISITLMTTWTKEHGHTFSEHVAPPLSSSLLFTITGFGPFSALVWPLTPLGTWLPPPLFTARFLSPLRPPLSLSLLLFLFPKYICVCVCVFNSDWRRYPFRADKTGALLHWRHQYSLHLRRPRCHCVSPSPLSYILISIF